MSDKQISVQAAILLLGTNSFTSPGSLGEFKPLEGFQDPVYQGKLFELDEVNAAANKVFNQKQFPGNYRPSIKIIFPTPVVKDGELKGSNELTEVLTAPNGNTVNKSELIEPGLLVYGHSRVDWNKLSDGVRKNYMLRALENFEATSEVNTDTETSTDSEDDNANKVDVLESDPEFIGGIPIDEIRKDMDFMNWQGFKKKYGSTQKEFRKIHGLEEAD